MLLAYLRGRAHSITYEKDDICSLFGGGDDVYSRFYPLRARAQRAETRVLYGGSGYADRA